MRPTEPLPLHHSWAIFEADRLFDLGHLDGLDRTEALPTLSPAALAARGIGQWMCNLRDQSLEWSSETYDLFGLPRHRTTTRAETLACYHEGSRSALERLRSYAIRHRRGFTLDVQIDPASGGPARWMRVSALPLCEQGRVVRLTGLKRILDPR